MMNQLRAKVRALLAFLRRPFVEADETRKLIEGLRSDLTATQAVVRRMAKHSNQTTGLLRLQLEKTAEWERGDKRMLAGSRRVIERRRRAVKRAEAERELASDPKPDAIPNAPDPAIVGEGQASS